MYGNEIYPKGTEDPNGFLLKFTTIVFLFLSFVLEVFLHVKMLRVKCYVQNDTRIHKEKRKTIISEWWVAQR